MKQLKFWMLAAIATLCGATMFTSCSNEDVPGADNPEKSKEYSLLSEDKVWTVKIESHGFNDTYVSYMEYKLMDKTSIDGISYWQLFTRHKQEGEDEWSEWEPGEFGGTTYIGEDNDGKVYYYDTYLKNFLLMDFSMQEGDVYRFDDDDYDVYPYVVTAVSDTILEKSFDRKPRKCIYLSRIANGEILTEDYHRDVWIEGIGSMKDGLMGMECFRLSDARQLMKCTQHGNIIYQYDNTTSVPRPQMTAILALTHPSTTCRAAVCPPYLKRACISKTARRNW